jgi:hypothetical protein
MEMKDNEFIRGSLRRARTSVMALALLSTVGLSACDSAVDTQAAGDTEEMVEMLTSELSLTTAESTTIAAAIENSDEDRRRRVPGWTWYLADSLQQVLGPERKAKLIELTERMEEKDLFGLVCFVGPGGLTGPDWKYRPVFKNRLQVIRLISNLLSNEQVTEIRAIQERYKNAVRDLIRQAKSGEITREVFAEELAALHAATVQEVYGVLTDEQIDALHDKISDRVEAYEAIVAAAKRAMYSALDATEPQVEAIETMCARLEEAKDALLQQHHEGEITREELKTALNALNEAEKSELTATLDDVQMEIVQIHKAILLRWRRIELRRHRDGRDSRFNAGDGGALFGTTTDSARPIG